MPHYVPTLSSEAGACLTPANWQEVAVSYASYSIDNLLLKPGYELLKNLSDINQYLNWPHKLILNASYLKANKEGIYSIISPYDGSKIKIDESVLFDLVLQLKPSIVLWPSMSVDKVNQLVLSNKFENTFSYFSASQLTPAPVGEGVTYGVYFSFESGVIESSQLAQWSGFSRYLLCEDSVELIANDTLNDKDFIQSDKPAKDAIQGLVYDGNQVIDLKSTDVAFDFQTISKNCNCPTCQQHLTKAYLHHLFHNTPLLCYRLMIQHNVSNISL